MSTTTVSNPSVSIQSRCALQLTGNSSFSSSLNFNPNPTLSAGNGVNQVDRVAFVNFSVTSGSPFTLNVSSGTDPLGNALGMLHVSEVIVQNQSTTAGQDMTVGGGTHPVLGSDQFTAQANGGIGQVFNPNPGYAVTSGSADTITVSVAAGTSVPGTLIVMGRSA